MKKLNMFLLSLGMAAFCLCTTPAHADSPAAKIGVVNAKKCLEQSKVGKQEQANFEKMKSQMESVLHEKETTLEDIETKLGDDDYLDSISEEAANELKKKRRTIRQEGMQLQNQYMHTLQQANVKIIQRITDIVNKAAAQVAKDSGSLDLIINDEACPYFNPSLDVTDKIIAVMNKVFDAEQAAQPKPAAAPAPAK